jgi:hypothetical protein
MLAFNSFVLSAFKVRDRTDDTTYREILPVQCRRRNALLANLNLVAIGNPTTIEHTINTHAVSEGQVQLDKIVSFLVRWKNRSRKLRRARPETQEVPESVDDARLDRRISRW